MHITASKENSASQQGPLQGYYPISIDLFNDTVKWVNLGKQPLTKPFFHDELARCSKDQYREQTLNSLATFSSSSILEPAGFIFHVSRCGSTLMTQQLMQLSRCLVLSEPPIIESVLSATRQQYQHKRAQWLKAAITALGQRQNHQQTHFIIKLDCWHIADLRDFQHIFPNTPCFLLYREPEAIFASHQRQMGVQMVPGLVDTTGLPIHTSNIHSSDLCGYTLEILRGIFASSIEQSLKRNLKLVNYSQLPEFTSQQLADAIQLNLTTLEKQALQKRALQHSKQPSLSFQSDQAPLENTSYQTRLNRLKELYLDMEQRRKSQSDTTSHQPSILRSTLTMTDAFHKLPLTFDTQRLKKDLYQLQQQHWLEHINRHAHDGGWASLPLRSVDGRIDNATVVETNPECYQNTPYLEQSEYLQEVLSSFQCSIVSARLMSLQAGQEIRRHTDLDLRFEDGCARLHIPIQTHPNVEFKINNQPIHFGEGECWYMNANYPHQVVNGSETSRVHLVIDCIVNDWLSELFSSSGYETVIVKHKYGCDSITDENVLQVIEQLEYLGSDTALEMAQHYKKIFHQSNG